MSWTFLQLTNRVLARLNEVQLTSSTFNTAVGFQLSAQGFVNDALNDIYDAELHWPFLWQQQTDQLTNYTTVYNLPTNQVDVDWDSFYLLGNLSGTPPWTPKKLRFMTYHDWQENLEANDDRIIQTHNLGQGDNGNTPDYVVPRQDMISYIVSCPPDNHQTSGSLKMSVVYDFWFKPTDLSLYTDTMVVPDMFSKVVLDGATYYSYMFRDNVEEAQAVQKKFMDGIAEMRRRLINKEEYMRSDQRTAPAKVGTSGYI